MITSTTAPATIRARPWPAPERTVLGRPGSELMISNRSLLRNGRRWIPVSGEIHSTRLPQERWRPALELLRAGGIDVVSTYVFWNHHQPSPDCDPDFTGNRDVAAFLRLCAAEGFPVVVRIGPWCHGEVRNGGLPDWVVASGHPLRTDSPGYLALVRRYFGFLGTQLAPLCRPGGPVIAVQAENELYDDPEHIRTVKALAQEAGIDAPLWTATGWGNAQLPVPEVFPVYSGYSDGFWVDAEEPWDDSFRSHFFFSDRWDDPGVGKDLAGAAWTGIAGVKHPDLPPATCELAGGMAAAYHCRPVPTGADIAALANVKLGSGSAWQGYYMYVGGTNPYVAGGLQESHATAYPNDLPTLNYDFHAPIGADLRVRESFHRLRLQHTFLAEFGDRLAGMTTTFPDDPATIAAPDADRGLRWCLRSDGSSGFVFVNNHQPVEPLAPVPDVQFAVELGGPEPVRFPAEPVEVPTGAVWCLPVGLTIGEVDIAWATVTPLTLLSGAGGTPVLVAYAHAGLAPQLALADGPLVDLVTDGSPTTVETASGGRLDVVVLDPDEALRTWTPTVAGWRWLVVSDADILDRNGTLVALADTMTSVRVLDPESGTWSRTELEPADPPRPIPVIQVRPASAQEPARRTFGNRASAPTPNEVDTLGARYQLDVGPIPVDVERAVLLVDLYGDVAQVRHRGEDRPFGDFFWDGEPWSIDLTAFRGSPDLTLDLRITGGRPGPAIRRTPAADRLVDQLGTAASIHSAELRLTRSFTIALDHHHSAKEA